MIVASGGPSLGQVIGGLLLMLFGGGACVLSFVLGVIDLRVGKHKRRGLVLIIVPLVLVLGLALWIRSG